MEELKFATENEALQYLADLVKNTIKIAKIPSKKHGVDKVDSFVELGDEEYEVVVEYEWGLPQEATYDDPENPGYFDIISVKTKKDNKEIIDELEEDEKEGLKERVMDDIPTLEEQEAMYADYMRDVEKDKKITAKELKFASENKALQYLADVTGKSIKVAMKKIDVDKFIDAYIKAMLWSSTDESDERGGEPLDKNYDSSDIAPEFMKKIEKDCHDFVRENYEYIKNDLKQAGYDFWLTRNGHGAGFWDGDWDFEVEDKNVGDYLTKQSDKYGEVTPYVGDDNKIYGA